MAKVSRRKFRVAGVGALVSAAALVLSACASIGQYGDHYTESFWTESSSYIAATFQDPYCKSADFAGNGGVGDAKDIAACTFFFTRVNICNKMNGLHHSICNLGTELNATTYGGTPMWQSFYGAALTKIANNWACLQIDFGGFGEIRRWKAAPLGFEGCRNSPVLPGTG